MNCDTEATVEVIRRRCNETAANLQCPVHQRNALVMVDGDELEHLEVEVFCCCDKFSKCVCAAVQETLGRFGRIDDLLGERIPPRK